MPYVRLRDGAGVRAAAAFGVRDNVFGAVASFTPRADRGAPAARSRWVFRLLKHHPAGLYRRHVAHT